MKSSYFIIFFSLGLATQIAGQSYHQIPYKNAKELYFDKKYNLAMEAFKPLMVYDADNPFVEYASYYYALAAYNEGYPAVAKDMMLQIKKLYPSWEQMEEVDFWLARIYFDERQYFQALHIMQGNQKGDRYGEEGRKMKANYLSRIDDVETLRMMAEEYPKDKQIGTLLVKAMLWKPFMQQDQDKLDSLISKYKLGREDFIIESRPVNEFKERYKVGILFPFLAKTLEPKVGQPRVNQFFLDMYQGMRMAIDTLRQEGIFINLLAYDTERDSVVTKELFLKPEMRGNDLLVGPYFQNQVKIVQEFSVANKINMINPVSGNSDFLGANPFALLYPPSYETLGRKTADLLDARTRNKNCVLFLGNTKKDSVMASSFIQRAAELDLNVIHVQVVSPETSVQIVHYLATPTEYDEFKKPIEFELKKDSIGSIFVASDDPLIYTKAISAIDTRGDSIILAGNESWLENPAINFETFERLHIAMSAPNFTPISSPGYNYFRNRYIKEHGALPNSYAKIGFEFIWFIGHALHNHGVYFQEGISEAGFIPGFLTIGYDYRSARDNQVVPFTHLQRGQLVLLDRR